MPGMRDFVRKSIPVSAPAYEWTEHQWRLSRGRRRVREVKASATSIMLDIGGGARAGTDGWLTVDVTRECDIYWDLRLGIPFETGTVARVYSSHLMEHLEFRDGQALMREVLRVLQPDGSFSIAVPNARLYIEAYLDGRQLPEDHFGWAGAYNGTTLIDAVNYVAYMDGHHKYMFDAENLVARLAAAGFSRATLRDFDPTTDMPERDYESIYAIGYKPVG